MSRPATAPPRPARPRSARLVALAVALAACGGAEGGAGPAVDSALVDVLAEVYLAEARAALSERAGGADSLRARALDAHDLDADALDRRLDALARDPALAEATYAAVAERLRAERRGGAAGGPAPF